MDYKNSIMVIGLGGMGHCFINTFATYHPRFQYQLQIDTDRQTIARSKVIRKMLIGESLCKGLGTGKNPEKGTLAAQQDIDIIDAQLKDAELYFLVAGMGGGSGAGIIQVLARHLIAKDKSVICLVTTPFNFEGDKANGNAEESIKELEASGVKIVQFDNQQLLERYGSENNFSDTFRAVEMAMTAKIIDVANGEPLDESTEITIVKTEAKKPKIKLTEDFISFENPEIEITETEAPELKEQTYGIDRENVTDRKLEENANRQEFRQKGKITNKSLILPTIFADDVKESVAETLTQSNADLSGVVWELLHWNVSKNLKLKKSTYLWNMVGKHEEYTPDPKNKALLKTCREALNIAASILTPRVGMGVEGIIMNVAKYADSVVALSNATHAIIDDRKGDAHPLGEEVGCPIWEDKRSIMEALFAAKSAAAAAWASYYRAKAMYGLIFIKPWYTKRMMQCINNSLWYAGKSMEYRQGRQYILGRAWRPIIDKYIELIETQQAASVMG